MKKSHLSYSYLNLVQVKWNGISIKLFISSENRKIFKALFVNDKYMKMKKITKGIVGTGLGLGLLALGVAGCTQNHPAIRDLPTEDQQKVMRYRSDSEFAPVVELAAKDGTISKYEVRLMDDLYVLKEVDEKAFNNYTNGETFDPLAEFSKADVLETLIAQRHSPQYLQALAEKLDEDGDFDKDGIKDYAEIRQGTNPLDPNGISYKNEPPKAKSTIPDPPQQEKTESANQGNTATVTITLTVAPGRGIVVGESGKIVQVYSNFTKEYGIDIENYVSITDWEKNKELGPNEYTLAVEDKDGNRMPLTEDVLKQYLALVIEYNKIGTVYEANQ